jgi:hypothetical protein
MSLANNALSPARLDIPLAAARSATLYRLPVYIACTMLTLIANYLLGKDIPWDALNYHLYAGFSAVNDRFAQDYFAAGAPSYFNPYAYVPYYAMVRIGLSPLAISSVLAVVHSVIFWLVFELAVCVCPSDNRRMQITYGVCAVAMTFLNPILVQEIGSSFADITTAELVLGGWLLLAQAVRTPQLARIVCAGLLIGAGTALKLTNSVHAIAACALLIMLPLPLTGRVRYGLGYVASLGLGFAVIAAPWSFRLERMFGNPMFPLMNGVFRSPEFTTEPLRHFRFIPGSVAEALWRPFAMVDPVAMVQEELTAPDLRYAALVLLSSALLVRWLWKRFAHSSVAARAESGAARVLTALGCGLAMDWVLWLSASGNGRYFLPMASVAAVVIVALIFRLFAARPKVRNYILAVILGTQTVQLCVGANHRWTPVPWDHHWLGVEVPEKLATEANLYLTVGAQSNSFIAAFLAKNSGLVNFSGAYALGPEGATGARIAALVHRYAPHLRVLWRLTRLEVWKMRHDHRLQVDDSLLRFGLRIDRADCVRITLQGLPPDPEILNNSVLTELSEFANMQPNTSYLMSCRIVPDDSDRSAEIARERAVNAVFDRVEDACPALFQPRRLRTERYDETWQRLYVNTDLVLSSNHGSLTFTNPIVGGVAPGYLGLERDWAKGPLPLMCGRRNGRYFADVLKSQQQ